MIRLHTNTSSNLQVAANNGNHHALRIANTARPCAVRNQSGTIPLTVSADQTSPSWRPVTALQPSPAHMQGHLPPGHSAHYPSPFLRPELVRTRPTLAHAQRRTPRAAQNSVGVKRTVVVLIIATMPHVFIPNAVAAERVASARDAHHRTRSLPERSCCAPTDAGVSRFGNANGVIHLCGTTHQTAERPASPMRPHPPARRSLHHLLSTLALCIEKACEQAAVSQVGSSSQYRGGDELLAR